EPLIRVIALFQGRVVSGELGLSDPLELECDLVSPAAPSGRPLLLAARDRNHGHHGEDHQPPPPERTHRTHGTPPSSPRHRAGPPSLAPHPPPHPARARRTEGRHRRADRSTSTLRIYKATP